MMMDYLEQIIPKTSHTKLNSLLEKQFMGILTMLKVTNKIINILEGNNFYSHCSENLTPYNKNFVATDQMV
jgi:nitrate/TMAO reductase-like tetraheme cytochrome c subunit